MMDRRTLARFLAGAAVLYLAAYPAWAWGAPRYGELVARLYVATVPLWEEPIRTTSVDIDERGLVVHARAESLGFVVTQKSLYIDLIVLVVLVLACPGPTLRGRFRLLLLGYLPLALVHLLGFASAVHLAYATHDLVAKEIHPGTWSLYVVAPLRRFVYSDWILLLPFLVWGSLYVPRHSRLAEWGAARR